MNLPPQILVSVILHLNCFNHNPMVFLIEYSVSRSMVSNNSPSSIPVEGKGNSMFNFFTPGSCKALIPRGPKMSWQRNRIQILKLLSFESLAIKTFILRNNVTVLVVSDKHTYVSRWRNNFYIMNIEQIPVSAQLNSSTNDALRRLWRPVHGKAVSLLSNLLTNLTCLRSFHSRFALGAMTLRHLHRLLCSHSRSIASSLHAHGIGVD